MNLLVKSVPDPLFVNPGVLKPGDCGDELALNGLTPGPGGAGLIAGLGVLGPVEAGVG